MSCNQIELETEMTDALFKYLNEPHMFVDVSSAGGKPSFSSTNRRRRDAEMF